MREKRPTRTKWLTIRLTEDEYKQVHQFLKISTSSGISDYVRRLILNRPVNVKYRNTSVDDFLTDMLVLKRELNAIGNNFNQAVTRLHQISATPELKAWTNRSEEVRALLFEKINAILTRINELHQQWSQS